MALTAAQYLANVKPIQGGNINDAIQAATKANAGLSVNRATNPAAPAAAARSYGTDTTDPSTVAYYSDQIGSLQNLLNSTGAQEASGRQGIDTSYNNSLSRLNQDQSTTLGNYATQRNDTTADYGKALSKINEDARQGNSSLQRLLQRAGAGGGSAALITAPTAVSRVATTDRASSSEGYAKNLRDLDSATTAANTAYGRSREDLDSQRNSKLQQLLSGIASTKQDLLGQLTAAQSQLAVAKGGTYASSAGSRAANNAQIAALQAQLQNLPAQYADPRFAVQDVKADPVSLAQYQTQAAQLADGSNAGQAQDTTLPNLLKLLQDQQNSYYV